MNFFVTVAFTSSLLSLSINSPMLIAKNESLPKVGTVINVPSGVGCFYWLPKDTGKRKYIFVVAGDVRMNFNGQDVDLRLIKNDGGDGYKRKKVHTSFYENRGVKIKFVDKTVGTYSDAFSQSVIITISKGSRSKVIRALGRCDD
jgi:hypothetical protein